MKIYTYYDNINFACQDELLTLWKESWERKGFEAIILSKSDAESHPYYEEYVKSLDKLHIEIANHSLSPYGLSCWLRWLAYATQPEEKFYVGDYDVINNNLKPNEPENMIRLYDGECPCFASGTPSQFYNLCKKFITVTKENITKYIKTYNELKFVHFHDQEFFVLYFYKNREKNIDKDLKLTKNVDNFITGPHRGDNWWMFPLTHYSHYACKNYCKSRNMEATDAVRCDLIKMALNQQVDYSVNK